MRGLTHSSMGMDGKRRRSGAKATLCMPRLARGNGRGVTTPASLLERLREVVLRLIMLSALSKGTGGPARRREAAPRPRHQPDSYRSEAVEDCIEFFKKSAEGAKSSNAGAGDRSVEAGGGGLHGPPGPVKVSVPFYSLA